MHYKNTMKTRIILCAAFAAAIAASCQDPASVNPEIPGKISLNVNVGTPGTRAVIADGNTDDMTLHNVQVFVYNDLKELEDTSGVVTHADNITLSVVPGTKTIWAVVNAGGRIQAPARLDDFPSLRTSMSDNAVNSLVMTGKLRVNVLSSTDLTVPVEHVACKIVLDKVVRCFSDPRLAEIPMTLRKIYMSNVAADCDLGCSGSAPTDWIHKQGALDTTVAVYSHILYDTSLNGNLREGRTYNTKHTFYVYPNPTTTDSDAAQWCDRKTRLVLECEYNGQLCYYPITLPGTNYNGSVKTLERNKVYNINNLMLTRPGSQSKDSKEPAVSSNSNYEFSVSVTSWVPTEPYSEVF